MSNQKIKFIDLFCGLGGFRIALEKNNCECVFSSEIDLNVAKTYHLNFGEMPSGDITQINEAFIPNHDILCAGFPCQAFSIAGLRKGFDDSRGTLFFDVARILNKKRPKAFILENVKGIINHDNGKTLNIILNTLSKLGYEYNYKVLNAKDYGIPQNRERWYCIGIRKDLGLSIKDYKFPNTKQLKNDLNSLIELKAEDKYRVSDICLSHIEKFIEIKQIDVKDTTLAYEIRPSRCQFKNDGTAPCLTAKMGTGGNNIPVVVKQKRRLTEKECLKIMGYPKDYQIATGHLAYKQIGNSVVVPTITELAHSLVKLLNSTESLEIIQPIKELDFSFAEQYIENKTKEASKQLCIFP